MPRKGSLAFPTKQRIAENQRKMCAVEGCYSPRSYTKQYCRKCAHAFQRHGHPKARAIRPWEYAAIRKLVRSLLKQMIPEVHTDALATMAECLEPGREVKRNLFNPKYHAWKERLRLQVNKVRIPLALEHALSVMVMIEEQPRRFPNRATEVRAVGRAVLRLVPYYHATMWDDRKQKNVSLQRRQPAASAFDVVGADVFRALWPLAKQLARRIEEDRNKRNEEIARRYREQQHAPQP